MTPTGNNPKKMQCAICGNKLQKTYKEVTKYNERIAVCNNCFNGLTEDERDTFEIIRGKTWKKRK